jgi:hypothetical protein
MIDLFHAVSECGDLIAYWDVGRHHDGVLLLRARSRLRYSTEHAATEAATTISERLHLHGYDVRKVSATARADGEKEPGWHGFVEILVS